MPVWRGHSCLRVVAVSVLLLSAILPKKCHEPLPKNKERRQKCRKQPDRQINPPPIRTGKGLKQNRIFAEDPRQWPEPSNGKCPGGHGPERPRDFLPQPTHLAHVL